MAEVLFGDKAGDRLVVSENKTQAYGLSGNDTLFSDGKNEVLLIGGSGDDSLIMTGGTGTLSGGKGKDTFELTYSADKSISAVIEDLEPSNDKIVVNFDGKTRPQLSSVRSGNDVVWKDGGGLFNLTLKSVRDNDYFDGTISEEAWEVLKITNTEREKENLPALTMSKGLTAGATIRAEEIASLGADGLLTNHTRPNGKDFSTVLNNKYDSPRENLDGGANSPAQVMEEWMNSQAHRENILNKNSLKLGVGYIYDDADKSDLRYYWTQLFADSLKTPETISTAKLSNANLAVGTVSKAVTLTGNSDTYNNADYSATIEALGGKDSITNAMPNVSISGGSDNDTIENSGADVTINAGAGNDLISLSSDALRILIQYSAGDGSDIVNGFKNNDTLSIFGNEYTPVTLGKDIIVSVGSDSITLAGAADLSSVNIDGTRSKFFLLTDSDNTINNTIDGATVQALAGNDEIKNYGASVAIDGGTGDDQIVSERVWGDWNEETYKYEIISSPDFATISGGAGNDYIGSDGSNSTINGGEGNDNINNGGASSVVDGGAGNDTITGGARGGEYSTLLGGAGDDEINNYWVNSDYTYIDGGDGDDTINDHADNSTISGGAGNDSIRNYGSNVSIDSGSGNDTVSNDDYDVSIDGGAGNDSIRNYGANATINAGSGNDTIDNRADNSIILGGSGNDSIHNSYYDSVTIDGGAGNDSIYSYGDSLSINGGSGNDTINGDGEDITILGGKGNDLIDLISLRYYYSNLIEYTDGDGRDTISNFNVGDTLKIGDGTGTYSTQTSGDDIIVNVGRGSIRILNAVNLGSSYYWDTPPASLNIAGTLSELTTEEDNHIYINDSGSYANSLEGAIISGASGIYSISNTAFNVLINVGDGDNTINNNGSDVEITSGEGNDSIINNGENVTINAGDGDNTIDNSGSNVEITSGKGNDSICNSGENITTNGGRGNDTIELSADSENNVIEYAEGDGSDVIEGFKENDTLNILNGKYVRSTVGNDVILAFDDDSVTLLGAAKVRFIHIAGAASEENKFITLTEDADTLENNLDGATIQALGGNDTIYNGKGNVSIDGGAGDDSILNSSEYNKDGSWWDNISDPITLNGGEGNDSIYNDHSDSVIIDAGNGDNYIENWGYSTNISICTGNGSDTIEDFYNSHVTIDSGAGNDSIWNRSTMITINAGDGDDTVLNQESYVTIDGGNGNDFIDNVDANVSINAGTGNDTIGNTWGDDSTIEAGEGDDFIDNGSNKVTINAGDGNDSIETNGESVSIDCGAGDDFVGNNFWMTSDEDGNKYYTGESQALSITGGAGNDRISLSSNAKKTFIQYNVGDGDDTIWGLNSDDTLQIGDGTGAYSTQVSGDDVIVKVGTGSIVLKDFRDKPKHIILGESASSGGTSTSSNSGNSASGNGSSGNGNGSNSSSSNNSNNNTSSGSTDSSNDNGGSSGNGNGTVGQIVDNVVDFSNTPSTPEVIDRRGVKEFEAISGSNNPDSIYAGDGGASLWGGNGFASDTLVGGLGKDIFVCGKNQGADLILNAAPKDTIFFNDATIDDVISAVENNLTISVTFNTGNVVTIKSPELLSAKLQLADGNAYRFNHMGRTWQKA